MGTYIWYHYWSQARSPKCSHLKRSQTCARVRYGGAGEDAKRADYILVRLFDKRGSIYSDRPPSHIANDIMFTNDTHILFVPYGDSWRKLRKTLQGLLNIKAVDRLLPIQNAEATQMMHQLLQSPDDWYDHVRRYSTSVILASVYGLRGPTFEHPRVKSLYHVQDQLTQIAELGATPPVDVFPILQYLPDFLSPWRIWARNIRKEHRALYFNLLNETQELVAKNKAPEDSFMVRLLKEQDMSGLDDEHLAYIGGSLVSDYLLLLTKPHIKGLVG